MRARKIVPPRNILVVDVGGSHVKFRLNDRGPLHRFPSGPAMTAADMVRKVKKRSLTLRYDAVSIGYPGVVFRGRIIAEPHNLGPGWVGFDFATAFGKPVRLINDAAMQAIGSYAGGRMLFLGLGTGMGSALILDGVVEPMEIGHMFYKRDRTFEDYVGERGLKRLGVRKWSKTVTEVVDQLKNAFEAEYVVLGGGNARILKTLPKGARLGDNGDAFSGGLFIWRYNEYPLMVAPRRRARAGRVRR